MRLAPRLGAVAAAGLALALVASQLSASLAYVGALADLPRQPYGVPLVYMQRAATELRTLSAQLSPAHVYTCCSPNQALGLNYLVRPALALEGQSLTPPLALPADFGEGALFLVAHNDAYDPPLAFTTVDDGAPLVARLGELGFVELPERAIAAPGRVLYRFFRLPADRDGRLLPTYAKPAGTLTLSDGRQLTSYRLPARLAADAAPRLSLLWRTLPSASQAPLPAENFFVHLLAMDGTVLAQQDWEVARLPLEWHGGDYLLAEHELALPADLAPGIYWLELGAYNRYTRQPLPLLDAAGQQGPETLRSGPIRVAPPANPPAPQVSAEHQFGDWLSLAGYDLSQAGPALDFTLHWQALASPPADYTISVQLLDSTGRVVAQHDAPPRAGAYPTSYWAAGETVLDQHTLALPANLPDGQYRLLVVVYAQINGLRLPVGSGDAALLTTLTVAGGQVSAR